MHLLYSSDITGIHTNIFCMYVSHVLHICMYLSRYDKGYKQTCCDHYDNENL